MKRKKALRIFIIVIVVILTVFMVLLPFLSYIIYAESAWQPARETAVKLADALELNRGIYRSEADGARLTEQYLTFTPGGSVSPLVVYGHDIYGAASMKTAVRYAEEETGHRVIGAVNGDFYTVETGVSVGMVIREGTLRTSDDGERNVLAFDRDGNATIGVSGLSISVTGGSLGDALKNIHFNKPLGPYSGAVLFDASFEATDKNTAMKRSVYLTVKSGEMKVGGTLECEVLSTQDIAYENALRSGYLVLSAELDTIYTAHLDALGTLAPGDTVTIAIEGNDLLLDAENAVGAGELLVENGENVAPAGTSPAPRTAAGIRADGTVLLYTVDGRQENYSVGMTQQELADRLIELGCVSAVNLDGGGSTTLEAVRPGDEALSLINQPSAGSLRSCANYILFLNTKAATGNLAHLHLYPLEATMLPGASVAFDVLATDSAYWPVTFQASTATFRTDGLGTMRETVFTAGDTAGSGTLTARFGSASGTAKITVVDKVDSIVIRSEDAGTELASLTIKAGASIDLTAAAVRNGLEVLSADASYEWAVTGGIGTVDADGVFTAFDAVGEGTVSCEAGGVSAAVDVKVVPEGVLLADFEAGEATYNGRAGTGIESKILANDREYVRYGQKSLELDYDFGLTRDGETAFYPLNLRLGDNATELRLWVYGDGSGNAVSAEFGAFTGLVTVDAGTLDFTGWKQLVIAVPVSARTLTNLNLTKTEGGAETGKIYLDQILSSRGEYADLTAPQVTLSVEGRTLTGLVTDDMDGEIPRERVTVTFDGKPLDVNYSLAGQSFTATLPAADAYDHMIAATAEDLSGNRSRVFLTLAAEKKNETDEEGGSGDVYAAEIPFIDTAGHWSESYANYLYQQGLSEGSETADGIVYRPEDYMNRQEIAVMLARWLGVNGAYDGVVLPYNDTDEIADWALPAAKAMYALGIIQGSENEDGTVSFLPAALLSREGIMTMIGRIQDKGYAESDMDFTDADKVSDWALPYVRSLVGQKVITGDAGWLRPLDPVKRGEAAKIICCLY